MTIDVEFMGPVRRPWPENKRALSIGDGTTIARLLADLGFRADEIRYLWVAVNNEKAGQAQPLREGDQVTVSLLVGGG